jgi:hypothetical protein
MSTVTPNFNWPVPTSTDLVRDGATAIEALGDSIDASFVDLKGGTTGQVLSKTTNTDLDFTWVTTDDANAIQNSIVDAKGDLIAATANDTPARLAVGTNGQILTADSTAATGIKWATPATAASGLTLITSATFSAVSSVSLPNSTFSSTYTNYKVIFIVSSSSANTAINCRYRASGTDNSGSTHYSALTISRVDGSAQTQTNINGGTFFTFAHNATGTPGTLGLSLDFTSPQAAAKKQIMGTGFGYNSGMDAFAAYSLGAWMNSTSQFDSFSFLTSGGATITGSYFVYGYQN